MIDQKTNFIYTKVENPNVIRKQILTLAVETTSLLKNVGSNKILANKLHTIQDLRTKLREIRKYKLSLNKALPSFAEEKPEIPKVHIQETKKVENKIPEEKEHKEEKEDLEFEESYEERKLSEELLRIQKKLNSL